MSKYDSGINDVSWNPSVIPAYALVSWNQTAVNTYSGAGMMWLFLTLNEQTAVAKSGGKTIVQESEEVSTNTHKYEHKAI